MKLGLTRQIFALFLTLALLCPLRAYSESGDEFIPPGQYQQDATNQKISGIRDIFFGDDPIATYAVLTYFTIQRWVALKDLFTQVPSAIEGAADFLKRKQLREEYLNHWNKMQELMQAQPELFHDMQYSAGTHSDRLGRVEEYIRQLEAKPALADGPRWRVDLLRALDSWKRDRDITRLDEFLERYQEEPAFKEALGARWLKDYNEARHHEEMASADLTSRANKITERMNEMLPYNERNSMVTHADPNGRHQPGTFFHFGKGSGPIRLTSASLVEDMKESCTLAYTFIKKQSDDKSRTGSWYSPVVGLGKIGIPVFTIGSAGVLTALTARVYYLSFKKYGKDPSAASVQVRHEKQVSESVTVQGEASFSGQVAKRQDDVRPLLDPLAKILHDNRAEILEMARKLHAMNPELEIDYDDKAKLLEDPEAIKKELSKHLTASKDLIAPDFTFNQFLIYMNRAPNDRRHRGETAEFVDDLYSRTLDGMFKELKIKLQVSVDGKTVPLTLGTVGTDELRPRLVKEALPRLENLKLPAPENTPAHPSIPSPSEPKRGPATKVTDGGLDTNADLASNAVILSGAGANKPQPEGKIGNSTDGYERNAQSGKGPELGDRPFVRQTACPSSLPLPRHKSAKKARGPRTPGFMHARMSHG